MHDLDTIKRMNSAQETVGSEDELKQKTPEKGSMVWTDELVMEFARVYSAGAYGQYTGCKTIKAKLNRFKAVWDEVIPLGSEDGDWVRVGDVILWSGSWGRDIQKPAKVTKIEADCNDLARDGTSVVQMLWADLTGRENVVTLDNGHWAYAFQIKQLDADYLITKDGESYLKSMRTDLKDKAICVGDLSG